MPTGGDHTQRSRVVEPIGPVGGAALATAEVRLGTDGLGAPVGRARRLRTMAGPVLCGCALAGAAVLVAVNDPAAAGSRFPSCGFRAATGLWCPGCGLTRATHHLLNGHPGAALASNVFTPFVLLAIMAAWVTWTAGAFGRTVRNPFMRMPVWGTTTLVVLLVAYGVLRNLPGEPWSSLAP